MRFVIAPDTRVIEHNRRPNASPPSQIDVYSTNEDAVKMLVGNKIDLGAENRAVSTEDGKNFARANAMLFIEASAKTEDGVL